MAPVLVEASATVVFWTGIALVLILGFVIGGGPSWYGEHHAALAPLLTLMAGVRWRPSPGPPFRANRRRPPAAHHRELQQGREQLRSDKLEVRLGGIYSLERISEESPEITGR